LLYRLSYLRTAIPGEKAYDKDLPLSRQSIISE